MALKHIAPDYNNVGKVGYIIGPDASGHRFPKGTKVTIINVSSPYYSCQDVEGKYSSYSVYPESIKFWATRAEHAAVIKDQLAELDKERSELAMQYESLTKFDSDEEEVASLIVAAMDDNIPKEKRIKTLSKMLSGRLKTDLL